MLNNYILFQAYGKQEILAECRFALLQLLQYNNSKDICLVLYTDDPSYFTKELEKFDCNIIETITPELIIKWRGKIDFVHRVKVEILLHFFSKHSGSVLYCDTDTYCLQPIIRLFKLIENDTIYMHCNEGLIRESNNIVIKKWKQFLNTKNMQVNVKTITDIHDVCMWNAGLIGLSSNKAYLLKEVLNLTDSIYPIFPKHTVEQFAFSYVLQKNGLITAAEDYIFHYWNLKEYRVLLNKFYEINRGKSLQELAIKILPFMPHSIMKDKMAYKNLPVLKKLFTKKWDINSYSTFLFNNSI